MHVLDHVAACDPASVTDVAEGQSVIEHLIPESLTDAQPVHQFVLGICLVRTDEPN